MNTQTLLIVFIFLAGLFISPVVADLKIIRAGGTIFLGEEGLDITASGIEDGGQIGWWAPGSSRSSEPTEIMSVSNPTSFYVSPSTFSGKEGLWYAWPDQTPVFQVKKPQISVRVYDESSDFDASGKWVPRGDAISFRISSNVYEANSRGGPDGQVDIILISPQGARLSSVSGPSGSLSLTGIPLTSSLTSTGPVWSTGGVDSGTWIVQAELSMNRIKDNFPDMGSGISTPVEILIQNVNPLIKSPVAIEVGTPTQEKPIEKETSTPVITPKITRTPTIQTTPTSQGTSVFTQSEQPNAQKKITESSVLLQPTVTIHTDEEEPTTESTPYATQTQTPLGLASITGALLVLFIIRRS